MDHLTAALEPCFQELHNAFDILRSENLITFSCVTQFAVIREGKKGLSPCKVIS
jgi:hypothetical protein